MERGCDEGGDKKREREEEGKGGGYDSFVID